MSGFQRFVTYLNLYEENQKVRNTGFAKVEKRNEQCKIEIHMKNTGYSGKNCPVYLYTRQNNKLMGILVGEIQMQNGNGNLLVTLPSTNLSDSGYDFDQIHGIIVTITEKDMIASQWDDQEINRNQFLIMSKREEGAALVSNTQENTSEIKAAVQASDVKVHNRTQSAPNAQNKVQPAPNVQNRTQSATNAQNRGQPASNVHKVHSGQDKNNQEVNQFNSDNIQAANVQTDNQNNQQAVIKQMPQRNRCPRNNIKVMEAARKLEPTENVSERSEDQSEKEGSWEQKWQFILENYPIMTPFEGEENNRSVRLELKDIRILPKRYWYLGNNSFLLHGFFNYRYLLLGCMEIDGIKKWYIGVPGVFQSQEKVMATLFGFPEFKTEKISEHKTGQFGYWYRIMDE